MGGISERCSVVVKSTLELSSRNSKMTSWEHYDAVEANQHARREYHWFLEQHISKIPLPDNCLVLDVGCGYGNKTHDYLLPFLPKGATLYGIDIDPRNIEKAKQAYGQSGIRFIVLDALDLCQLDMKFDLIVSSFCLHLIPNLVKLWESLSSSLSEAGTIMVLTFSRMPNITACVLLSQEAEFEECLKDLDKVFPGYLLKGSDPTQITKYHSLVKETLPKYHVTFTEGKNVLPMKDRAEFLSFLRGINYFNHRMDSQLEEKFLDSLIGKMQEVQKQPKSEYCMKYEHLLIKVQRK